MPGAVAVSLGQAFEFRGCLDRYFFTRLLNTFQLAYSPVQIGFTNGPTPPPPLAEGGFYRRAG